MGWEHVRWQLNEPELPQAGEGCGLVPSGGLVVNGRFLPLLARWVQPLRGGARAWGARPPANCCLPPPQLLEGNFALFCTYTLGFRNEFQNILLAIMVCMALSWSPSGVRLVGCVLGDPPAPPQELAWDGCSMG